MDPGSRLPIPMAVVQLLEAVVLEVAHLSEELAWGVAQLLELVCIRVCNYVSLTLTL